MTLEDIEAKAKEIFPDYFVEICKDITGKRCVRIWNQPNAILVYLDGQATSLYMASYQNRIHSCFLTKVDKLLDWIRNEIIGENLVN